MGPRKYRRKRDSQSSSKIPNAKPSSELDIIAPDLSATFAMIYYLSFGVIF